MDATADDVVGANAGETVRIEVDTRTRPDKPASSARRPCDPARPNHNHPMRSTQLAYSRTLPRFVDVTPTAGTRSLGLRRSDGWGPSKAPGTPAGYKPHFVGVSGQPPVQPPKLVTEQWPKWRVGHHLAKTSGDIAVYFDRPSPGSSERGRQSRFASNPSKGTHRSSGHPKVPHKPARDGARERSTTNAPVSRCVRFAPTAEFNWRRDIVRPSTAARLVCGANRAARTTIRVLAAGRRGEVS